MTLDRANNQRDTSGATQDTSGGEQRTSNEETPTFTAEQVEEEKRKAKSDVSAELGRVKKLNADLIKSSQLIQERLTRRDEEEDERERERYQDNPDKLSAIGERIKRRNTESELAEVRLELNEKAERIKLLDENEVESTKEQNAREIASRLGVDSKRLAKLAKFTDGSREAIEEIAGDLPKTGEPLTLIVDSSRTIGGGVTISRASMETPEFQDKYLSDPEFRGRVDSAWREGKIKQER